MEVDQSMKILIVTSEITFVPRNYHTLTLGLSSIPEVYGLMVIRNRNFSLFSQALSLILTKAAPSLGWQLVQNFASPTNWIRRKHYESQGKKFWVVDDINSHQSLELIRQHEIDVILNTRTRTYYRPSLLKIPRLGCLNIHHGLLPEQRGLMCDLWAHAENTRSGVTLHEIVPRLDAGKILRRVVIPQSEEGYLDYLEQTSLIEMALVQDLVREIRETGHWQGAENQLSVPFRYRNNPSIQELLQFRRSGLNV